MPSQGRKNAFWIYQKKNVLYKIFEKNVDGLNLTQISTVQTFCIFKMFGCKFPDFFFESIICKSRVSHSLVCFQVPEEMQDKEFAAILQDEPQQPLALLPLTEEEQVRGAHLHIWHLDFGNTHYPVKVI